jgi:hypothetical protein
LTLGAMRAHRDETGARGAGVARRTLARLVATLSDHAAGILNAVAFISLGAALLALLVL